MNAVIVIQTHIAMLTRVCVTGDFQEMGLLAQVGLTLFSKALGIVLIGSTLRIPMARSFQFVL